MKLVCRVCGLAALLAAVTGVTLQAKDTQWVMKTATWELSQADYSAALKLKGLDPAALTPEQKRDVLQELFIRETLAQQAHQASLDQNTELLKQVDAFKQDLIAHAALDQQVEQSMPDFTDRAKELYQAKLASDYSLPVRLRIAMIRIQASSDDTTRQSATERLQTLKAELAQNKITFAQAIERYSDLPDKSLTKSEGQWIHQGQIAEPLYQAALTLNTPSSISDIVSDEKGVYLLQVLERKEAEVIPFASAKAEIEQQLKNAYRNEQRQSLVEQVRQQFKDVQLNEPH